MDTDTGVVAVIDAAEDEVGATRQDLFPGKFHAIYWRAGAGKARDTFDVAGDTVKADRHRAGDGAGRT